MKLENINAWNSLFSSLAFAEKAAANECLRIAQKFRSIGLNHLSDEYEHLAVEENHHHELALSITKEIIPLTKRAEVIYEGGFFSENSSVLERLMSVHFVFEPSALAFLGYIVSHSNELIQDQDWKNQITKAFKEILFDEVNHVQTGGELIKKIWKTSKPDEREAALKTMRKHRAFLKAGLLSFFPKDSEQRPHILKMLQRFDFYYERSIKGVSDAEQAQIAS
jgi:hypothetical protein